MFTFTQFIEHKSLIMNLYSSWISLERNILKLPLINCAQPASPPGRLLSSMEASPVMLQQNTWTQRPKEFLLDRSMEVVLKKIFKQHRSMSIFQRHIVFQNYPMLISQNRVSIIFPAWWLCADFIRCFNVL